MYQRKASLFTRITALTLLFALLLTSTVVAATPPTPPNITADSAIVMDYDTGEVLYEKDADTMRVPASMTKVMTAYIIFEELEAGNLTLDTMVPVSNTNADRSRSSSYPAMVPLPYGKSQSVDTLLKLILIPSASASCIVMADYISGSEAAFVQRMNETAKRLGMTAEYENSHGAHVHYLTARSQAILVREFISRFPQVLEYTSMTGMTFNGKYYPNTNKLLPGLDYAYDGVDGFKTGTISAAGYCLSATAVKNGRRIISVVMHADDDKTRHTDTTALLDYGFAMLEYQAPYTDMAYHWGREDVAALKDLGVELHPDGESFRPDANVTRAEFTAMLYTALAQSGALPELPEETTQPPEPTESALPAQEDSEQTLPPENTTEPDPDAATTPEPEAPAFTDIQGHWAQTYIEEATRLGLISGTGSDTFSPDQAITRQEMMVLIDRCMDLPDENGLGFSDDGQIAFWALEAAARTTAAGLIQGNNGKLMPNASASRAQAAAMVNRLLDLTA
ncbi:S-layer homology domain-containing protein [Pseudoflavonifractor phocaeensis]|uniref:S-layer homology domain-containing protein n=1 Tax=Pseudoflavonifractor phocaeensis TaxID=1870988 RepID=UPI00195951F5|nr:S-layer homology domain-containing protein [Pseudoflavonifractor phocaeensis]MBM6725237.1 S-layer homology domain-containing protein [Pseudoflavonifractor phocaeensis]